MFQRDPLRRLLKTTCLFYPSEETDSTTSPISTISIDSTYKYTRDTFHRIKFPSSSVSCYVATIFLLPRGRGWRNVCQGGPRRNVKWHHVVSSFSRTSSWREFPAAGCAARHNFTENRVLEISGFHADVCYYRLCRSMIFLDKYYSSYGKSMQNSGMFKRVEHSSNFVSRNIYKRIILILDSRKVLIRNKFLFFFFFR